MVDTTVTNSFVIILEWPIHEQIWRCGGRTCWTVLSFCLCFTQQLDRVPSSVILRKNLLVCKSDNIFWCSKYFSFAGWSIDYIKCFILMKILRKQILPRFVKISFLFCLKYILIGASLPSMVGRFSSSLASLSPGISPSLSAFRVIVLMLRVCFKPIRLFQMYPQNTLTESKTLPWIRQRQSLVSRSTGKSCNESKSYVSLAKICIVSHKILLHASIVSEALYS